MSTPRIIQIHQGELVVLTAEQPSKWVRFALSRLTEEERAGLDLAIVGVARVAAEDHAVREQDERAAELAALDRRRAELLSDQSHAGATTMDQQTHAEERA